MELLVSYLIQLFQGSTMFNACPEWFFCKSCLHMDRMKRKKEHFDLFQPSAAFHIETSHLFCSVKQMTGFFIKSNTGLKWLKGVFTGKPQFNTFPFTELTYLPFKQQPHKMVKHIQIIQGHDRRIV